MFFVFPWKRKLGVTVSLNIQHREPWDLHRYAVILLPVLGLL